MLGALKKRLMKSARTESDVIRNGEESEKHESTSPSIVQAADGNVALTPPAQSSEPEKNESPFADRIRVIEIALSNLQDLVIQSNEKPDELLYQLEVEVKSQVAEMNQSLRKKNEKTLAVVRDYRVLQTRFKEQEIVLESLQKNNIILQKRIQQYEKCLDDVLSKVVDRIVAEDKLRMEVTSLKGQVHELQLRNAAIISSPSKTKDEGYSTLSSGQPQPSISHIEELSEAAEYWMTPPDVCSAEIEDWSLSQDEMELHASIDDPSGEQEWMESTSTTNNSEEEQPFTYSQELNLKEFPRNFYQLIEIYSCPDPKSVNASQLNDNDDEDDNESSLGNDVPLNLLDSSSSDGLTSSTSSNNEQHPIEKPNSSKKEQLQNTASFSAWQSSKSWRKLDTRTTMETLKPNKCRAGQSKIPLLKKTAAPTSVKTKLAPPPVPVRQTFLNKK